MDLTEMISGKACLKCRWLTHDCSMEYCSACGTKLLPYTAPVNTSLGDIIKALSEQLFGKRRGMSMMSAADHEFGKRPFEIFIDNTWHTEHCAGGPASMGCQCHAADKPDEQPSATEPATRIQQLRQLRDRIYDPRRKDNGMVIDASVLSVDDRPCYVEFVVGSVDERTSLERRLAQMAVSPYDYFIVVRAVEPAPTATGKVIEFNTPNQNGDNFTVAAFRNYCREYDNEVKKNTKIAAQDAKRVASLVELLNHDFADTTYYGTAVAYGVASTGKSHAHVTVYDDSLVKSLHDWCDFTGVAQGDLQIHIGTHAEWQTLVNQRIQAAIVAKLRRDQTTAAATPTPDDATVVQLLTTTLQRLKRKFKTHADFIGYRLDQDKVGSQIWTMATIKVTTMKMANRVRRHLVNYKIPGNRYVIIVVNIATNVTEKGQPNV